MEVLSSKLYAGTKPVDFAECRKAAIAAIKRPGYAKAFSLTSRTRHGAAETALAAVNTPTLVVMGELDQDFKDTTGEAGWVAEQLNGDVLTVPAAGHYPQSQRPNWSDRPSPPSRRRSPAVPRAGLTARRVTEEAEAVADEIRLASLTLAAVAARLGVRLASPYKHVDGMHALQRLIAIRAKNELAAVVGQAAVGKAGVQALQAMSSTWRSWAMAYPGRYSAMVRAPKPDDDEDIAASNAIIDVAFAVLAGYNLTGDDAIDAVRALRSTVHGFIVLEQGGGFGLPTDVGRRFERLVSGLSATLITWETQTPARHRT